ncbi:MAG: hypothetical protein L6R42_002759 [Xanthoria sp. 1 TBL-2021]|nr:MAG: hypothetical protein L6R42_002759 [Xanthoria sp. 1 TBL-2021]
MSEDNIIGYVDPRVSFPGEKPAVKVSCTLDTFVSQGFRLVAGLMARPSRIDGWKPFPSKVIKASLNSAASAPLHKSKHGEVAYWKERTRPTFLRPLESGSFNGKVDGFRVEKRSWAGHINTLLDLDFSLNISTDKVRDASGYERHGELINGPFRAVTGHNWDASQTAWTHASYGYGAIQFHDDDLDDAMWENTFVLDLPENLLSGCYGITVNDRESTDFVPFFVRPDPNAKRIPPVALIIPTFTYAGKVAAHFNPLTTYQNIAYATSIFTTSLEKRPNPGVSLYDSHNDGSGTVFSSLRRPVLKRRPDDSMWLFDGPREFSADLWFVDFLDRELGAQGFDVITDHDISAGCRIKDEERSNEQLLFISRGLESEAIFGDFGLVQGAASGDEIDRMDYALGTHKNAIMIAKTKLARGHSDEYMLFNEETLYPMVKLVKLHGTTSDKICRDIVYFETPSEGAVFSIGSINWVGALAWKAFDNNVARMTATVLHEFVRLCR